MLILTACFAAMVAQAAARACANHSAVTVKITTGRITGYVDPTTPNTRSWLGVPYAEPPTGPRRFLAPVPKRPFKSLETMTQQPSCQQWITSKPNLYSNLVQQFYAAPPFSEDCLYLNIYSPAGNSEEKLPVLIWLHGGAATYGGINVPYERPEFWVESAQNIIVVKVNYRLNVFGFPNAKGLKDNNLAILDVRAAVQWTRANAAAFGGDPSNIVLWGQAAGAAIGDIYQFAFPEDPIITGMILEGGIATQAQTTTDMGQTSFAFLADTFDCGGRSDEKKIECMRGVDAATIESFLQRHSDSGASPRLYFSASADNSTVFTPEEYLAKALHDRKPQLPILLGSNANEGAEFVPFSIDGTATSQTAVDEATLKIVQCPIAHYAGIRAQAGRASTHRYYFGGNFSNVSPSPWIGAYHSAEIPLVMGTHDLFRTDSTPFERDLSKFMQDLWANFAQKKASGLEKFGWLEYGSAQRVFTLGVNDTLGGQSSGWLLDTGCEI